MLPRRGNTRLAQDKSAAADAVLGKDANRIMRPGGAPRIVSAGGFRPRRTSRKKSPRDLARVREHRREQAPSGPDKCRSERWALAPEKISAPRQAAHSSISTTQIKIEAVPVNRGSKAAMMAQNPIPPHGRRVNKSTGGPPASLVAGSVDQLLRIERSEGSSNQVDDRLELRPTRLIRFKLGLIRHEEFLLKPLPAAAFI